MASAASPAGVLAILPKNGLRLDSELIGGVEHPVSQSYLKMACVWTISPLSNKIVVCRNPT